MSYHQLRETAPHLAGKADARTEPGASGVEIGLNAAIVAVADNEPVVLIIRNDADVAGATDGLPFGPFSPLQHRTFEGGLRAWVHRQTGLELGYAEQLYTFGDRGRHAEAGDVGPHVVSIGYLALTQAKPSLDIARRLAQLVSLFPVGGLAARPSGDSRKLDRAATARMGRLPSAERRRSRSADRSACASALRLDGAAWDEEKVLERYELLYEAGLVEEALRDERDAARQWSERPRLGVPMRFDHRRILATAIGRVRAKIKYRPVIFELMPDDFTLFELQRTVEAILGPHLHKQNFRRLVEGAGLVETTGEVKMRTGGRPAKLYRFRREVLLERPAPGVRVKPGKV